MDIAIHVCCACPYATALVNDDINYEFLDVRLLTGGVKTPHGRKPYRYLTAVRTMFLVYVCFVLFLSVA